MTGKQLLILLSVVGVILVAAGGGWYFWQMRGTSPASTGTKKDITETTQSEQSTPTTGGGMKAKINTNSAGPSIESITTIVMSASVSGAQATALAHTTSFASNTQKIYVTTILPPSTKADKAMMKVTYLKDGSVLGPVAAAVKTEDGVTFASFSMTSPPNGWPKGEYKALVTISTGEAQEVAFSVL